MNTEGVALSLNEILLSISDSLNQAQNQLNNMAPYDEYGRPNTMYQLPYLDFNLQVTSEIESKTETTSDTSSMPVTPTNSKYDMVFKPIPSSTTNSSGQKSEMVSTISGRFVAIAPNQGAPQVYLECNYATPVLKNGKFEVELEVLLANTAGETIVGSNIEFNYDESSSNSLNPIAAQIPLIDVAERQTDLQGKVTNIIKINAADYNAGRVIIITVNAGTISKSISISKP